MAALQRHRPVWGAAVLGACVVGLCLALAGCGRSGGAGGSGGSAGSGAAQAAAPGAGAASGSVSGAVSAGASSAASSAASDASGDVAASGGDTPPWPCTGWPRSALTAYDRADTSARVFATLQAGDPVAVVARDGAGWLAFSPGVAQAANVGPFRLRWLPPGAPLRLEGRCSDLPVRASPPPGVCFEMAMAPTPIRAAPSGDAAVLARLQADGYVAVTGRHGNGWLRVDAGSGSRPGSGSGWIAPEAVNLNGPCDAYLGSGSVP